MYLEISEKLLWRDTVYSYIAKNIEKQFPNSKEDADTIRSAVNFETVENIFNEYYQGWLFDGVKFVYGDIVLILDWMKQDKINAKKALEMKKYLEDLKARGIDIKKLIKDKQQKAYDKELRDKIEKGENLK